MKQLGLLLVATNFLSIASPSMIGCASEQKNVSKPVGDWYKLDAGYFSIYAPTGWTFHKLQGIDSYVGEFVGDGARLEFDYGHWSNPLDEAHGPKYVIAHESIDGHRAKIVSPKLPGQGLTGIYFSEVPGGNKLNLYGQNLTAPQQELALKIFRTIRFAEPLRR